MQQPFTPVFLAAELRAIERSLLSQPAPPPLMERAGLATAELARGLMGDKGKRILVIAGPGNNGGDAFVAARHLRQWWFKVSVVFAGDGNKLPADAKAALDAWVAAGGSCLDAVPADARPDLVIDGLFGIGLQRTIEGRHADLVDWINRSGSQVLAIDVPSGLHADSGRVLGCCVRAHHTVTFIGLKAGLLTLDGPDYAGEIHLSDIGIDIPARFGPGGWRLDARILERALPARPRNSHKGSFGTVGIVGGAAGMVGAALLAARAALNLGAGKVYVGLLDSSTDVDPVQPELMLRSAQEVLGFRDLDCLACGPGLGQSQAAGHLLASVLAGDAPLLLDADALNLLAADAGLQQRLAERTATTLLTPHPAEAARLLGLDTARVQADRIAAALEIARRFGAGVVLKGSGSICASAGGDWYVNSSGNPGMATAGMGDVLTGLVAALLAQGAPPDTALLAGVYLHGAAADRLVERGIGPIGLTASETIAAAREVFNQVKSPARAP